MRPTNLGFKSPREVCQAPQYNPSVTARGSKLLYASDPNKQLKQRPKSNLSSRFCETQRGNMSVFLGPGRYKDEHNTIMHTVKSKISPKYKGDVIDSRSSPYTYAGDAKVLDLAFLSPQAKKAAFPYVITTSITLTSPKVNTPTALGSFSNQSTAYSTVQQNKGSVHSNNAPIPSQGRHNRTKSMQVSEGVKAPWEKIMNNVAEIPEDLGQKSFAEYGRKGSIELTKAQKQRNDQIYNQLIDSQLSNDLKSLKKELENYQNSQNQKKKPVKEIQMYETKYNLSSTEGTFANTRKGTDSDQEETEVDEREKLGKYGKENGNQFIQIQEDLQALEPRQVQELNLPESRVLAETSSNHSNSKGPYVSFDGDGFITMNVASPKANEVKIKQKEINPTSEQKSLNKAIELKRRAVVTLTSSSSVHSVSNHSRSGSMTSKAVRKL